MKALLRLYPTAWRDRYGAEVSQLLDDDGVGIRAVPDLVRGAIHAHLHPADLGIPGGPRSDGPAGILAATGALLWLALLAAVAVVLGEHFDYFGKAMWLVAIGATCMVISLGILIAHHLRGRGPRLLGLLAAGLGLVGTAWMVRNVAIGHWIGPGAHALLSAGIALSVVLLLLATSRYRWSLSLIGASAVISLVFMDSLYSVFGEDSWLVSWALWAIRGLGFLALGWSALRRPVDEMPAASSALPG